jgi:hypothetical protein
LRVTVRPSAALRSIRKGPSKPRPLKVTKRWKRRIARQNSPRNTLSPSPMNWKSPSDDVSSCRASFFSYQTRPRPESGLSIATAMIFPVNGQSDIISGRRSRSSSVRALRERYVFCASSRSSQD